MTTWNGWQSQLLTVAGVPHNANNQQFMSDWHTHATTNCRNNPVDISLNISGASPCKVTSNPNHQARNYASHDQAAGQFAAQLHSGNYPHLLAALQSGNPYNPTGSDQVSIDIVNWGSSKFATAYGQEVNTVIASGVKAPRAHSGWKQMRTSFNDKMPAALHASQRSGASALRTLQRARKVRL